MCAEPFNELCRVCPNGSETASRQLVLSSWSLKYKRSSVNMHFILKKIK